MSRANCSKAPFFALNVSLSAPDDGDRGLDGDPTPAAAVKPTFEDYIPPSTSVVMERCFGGGSTISTSLIAVVPGAGYEINKIYPPGVASTPTSGLSRR